MKSRYDYYEYSDQADKDGEQWPDPLSVSFNDVQLTKAPPLATIADIDITKFWLFMNKNYGMQEMDDILLNLNAQERQRISVIRLLSKQGTDAVRGAEQVAAYLWVVRQRSHHSRIAHAAIQILKMPVMRRRIDGIALDLVRPVGDINHPVFAEHLVNLLLRT